MIAMGILASCAAYELWFSNLESRAAGQALAAEVQREWAAPGGGQPPGATDGEQSATDEPTSGEDETKDNTQADTQTENQPAVDNRPLPKAIGLLCIPRLKSDVWQTPLLENVSDRALTLGVGHYTSTALPGQPGNFALAGHRATFGEPFARIERLRAGDEAILFTAVFPAFAQWRLTSPLVAN